MPEPREWLVLKNLQAALQAIDVADGYHYDVRAAAVKLDPEQDVEALIHGEYNGSRPFVLVEVSTPERPPTWEYAEKGQVDITLMPTVYWVHESDQTDDDSRMLTFMRGCADVERAVTQDLNRGGLAVDTRVRRCTVNGTGSEVWAVVDLEILVIREYGQPDA